MNPGFDTEARVAFTQAADIARELGHREVGPDHLLLGLLANPRGTAYTALTDHGLTLGSARAIVAERHLDAVDPLEPGEVPEPSAYDDDREALRAIGIDLDRVREAVRDRLGQDLADGWGDRPERRGGGRGRRGGPGGRRGEPGERGRGRRRGRHHDDHEHHDHEHHDREPDHEHHDHEHHDHDHDHERHDHDHERGRGRRGPRSRRPDGPRISPSLRALLRDVRRSVLRDRFADDADRRAGTGLTGARMLLALTRCDDEVVQAVLATAEGLDALRAQAEVAARPTTV